MSAQIYDIYGELSEIHCFFFFQKQCLNRIITSYCTYVIILFDIQGKRSTSDHISQAVNYIKDLQNKIKELDEKKNRIKKSIPGTNTTHPSTEECTSSLSSSTTSTLSSSCLCIGDKHITVVVTPCLVGVEIIISCCVGRNKSVLSSVLQMLAQEQRLTVVSCLSKRLQQRFMHTIVSQVKLLLKNIKRKSNEIMLQNIGFIIVFNTIFQL